MASCSTKFFLLLFLLSAIPFALIIHLEISDPATHVFEYHSAGWFRECAKWDDVNQRFLVSYFDGGFGVIPVPENYSSGTVLEEIPVVNNVDFGKNKTLGFVIDRPRNRVVVAIGDAVGNRYGAVAAYDLTSWKRIFLTKLSGPEDRAFAEDLAVDTEGNAYITDPLGNKIWKVGVNGEFMSIIKSPLFIPKEWYNNLFGLNGIVYHPNGYLLVLHMVSGKLYKIEIGKRNEVKLVNIFGGGSLRFGDGMELLSPNKLVVAGMTSRLVESSDDWESATIVGKCRGATHRLATAPTIKDGKVYLSHILGLGYPRKKHVLVEAVFST
ncbi:Calcium-dependent phosphotriesterase superfamily protein [Forsythia ovata]|uniref:Calcium-dependent phosphotriesterase superfamily protein n=1 Tax=Forsythia ovata TaxID=205694 RepID=A0ABD1T4A6_9LAMI